MPASGVVVAEEEEVEVVEGAELAADTGGEGAVALRADDVFAMLAPASPCAGWGDDEDELEEEDDRADWVSCFFLAAADDEPPAAEMGEAGGDLLQGRTDTVAEAGAGAGAKDLGSFGSSPEGSMWPLAMSHSQAVLAAYCFASCFFWKSGMAGAVPLVEEVLPEPWSGRGKTSPVAAKVAVHVQRRSGALPRRGYSRGMSAKVTFWLLTCWKSRSVCQPNDQVGGMMVFLVPNLVTYG